MCISTNCLRRHSSRFLPLPRSSLALNHNTKDEMLLLLFQLWTVMRTLQKLLFSNKRYRKLNSPKATRT